MIKESMFFTEPTIKDYREMDVEKIIREHLLTKGTWSHPTLKDEKPKPINRQVSPKSLVLDGLYTYGLKANPTNKRAIEYYCERWARIHQIFDDGRGYIKVPDALWKECDEYNRKMTGKED